MSGGVWTVNVGYGRKRIADAVAEQLTKMCFFGGTAGTIPMSMFSEMLIDKMPGLDRVYYASSGSEANEKAFKMVRQISHKHSRRQEEQNPVSANATTTAQPSQPCRQAGKKNAMHNTGPTPLASCHSALP